jgi:hypothetical protein
MDRSNKAGAKKREDEGTSIFTDSETSTTAENTLKYPMPIEKLMSHSQDKA